LGRFLQRFASSIFMMSPMNHDRCWAAEMALCLVFMCSILACAGHTSGGGNPNPSIYNSYNNYPQQQWQQQQQNYPFPENEQYQQQQLYQPQKAFEPAEPDELKTPMQEVPPLPPGWSEHIDPSSGQPYYYNMVDGTTTWDRPLVVVNNTVVDSEDTSQYQEQHLDISPTPALSQQEYSKPIEAVDTTPPESFALTERAPASSIGQRFSTESMPVPESDAHNSAKVENVLTAVTRDEKNIRDEESWRVSQGWNNAVPSGHGNNSSENALPFEDRQQNQGWGLPPPQSDGWGLSKTPKTDVDSVPPVVNRELGDKTDHFRQADRNPFPQQHHHQPHHSQDHIAEQHVYSQGMKPPEVAVHGAHFNQPGTGQGPKPMSHSSFGEQQDYLSGNRVLTTQSGQQIPPIQRIPSNQQKNAPYQEQQHVQQQPHQLQQPPPRSNGQQPLPSDTSRVTHQQVPPYFQAQPPLNPTSHVQQPQQQAGNLYGQRPPIQYGPQYGQPQNQYLGAPIYGQQPPKQGSQTSYASQPGQGQLISQDQQNLVKESLGRTWQSILGLRDRTKEVVETATSTVAQSAREASQTITEKGTGKLWESLWVT
jgi:WW domain